MDIRCFIRIRRHGECFPAFAEDLVDFPHCFSCRTVKFPAVILKQSIHIRIRIPQQAALDVNHRIGGDSFSARCFVQPCQIGIQPVDEITAAVWQIVFQPFLKEVRIKKRHPRRVLSRVDNVEPDPQTFRIIFQQARPFFDIRSFFVPENRMICVMHVLRNIDYVYVLRSGSPFRRFPIVMKCQCHQNTFRPACPNRFRITTDKIKIQFAGLSRFRRIRTQQANAS